MLEEQPLGPLRPHGPLDLPVCPRVVADDLGEVVATGREVSSCNRKSCRLVGAPCVIEGELVVRQPSILATLLPFLDGFGELDDLSYHLGGIDPSRYAPSRRSTS